jgi:heptosyltransferase-2
MRIFIELPTWLGDCIMTTPAICNLIKFYKNYDLEIVLFGSNVSTTALQNFPYVKEIIIDNSKKESSRLKYLYKVAKSVGKFDLAFSFRKHFATKMLLFFINAKKKSAFKVYNEKLHQVQKYNDFIKKLLIINYEPKELKLFYPKYEYKKPTLGINPGATYGSAKRWYPKEFATVAIALSNEFDIVIFGGANEQNIANDIEKELKNANIKNYKNLAGKTTIEELISFIGGLDLFITNDSGPMHIASAYQVKTVAIFGPTSYIHTSPWQNPNAYIVKKELSCMPCMKRVCPKKTHECMKQITALDVLKAIKE